MQVAVENQLTLLLKLPHVLLDSEDHWLYNTVGILPSSVHILATQWAPVVAIDHSIWVKDGHNLEDKVVSECLGFRCIAY